MITKQELIDIMKEGWQPSGYYSVDFNANMVADKIHERIKNELEVLEIFKKNTDIELLKTNENAPIFVTILRVKPLTNTIDKEYQKVKRWLEND